ncbi:MAG: hypothetical protein KatS3mg060_0774 [Dehalococcoidia bacterium]|nr:MAG: hypothetical protein KatS3mg060_0774 [Dehalococcoidia bacterium]
MAARPYYGWTIVGALAISETISWGVLSYAFGVFVTPMERDLGWSRAELTGAVSVGALVTGVAAVPVGRWIDRHGARLLMTAGSIVGSAMVLAWSMVESLPVFYLIWAGIGLAMAATLYEPAFAVIAVWFERRRGQALTVLTFAAGFASTIFLPLSDWLVSVQGWRGALASLAVLLAVSTVPLHALVLRRRPADLGLQPDGAMVAAASTHRETAVSLREAVSQPAFAALAAAFFLVSLATTALTVNLVPLLISRPLDPALAATIGGLVGAASSFGRLALAPWWGRFAPATIAAGGVPAAASGRARAARAGRGRRRHLRGAVRHHARSGLPPPVAAHRRAFRHDALCQHQRCPSDRRRRSDGARASCQRAAL